MSEQAAERIWSGIDITKALGGALAAVCAAVLGSFLGVAGTLIGAALASIIGTIGTEIYTRSLKRGAQKLQTLAPAFVTAPAAVGTPEVAAATEDDKPSETVPEVERHGGRKIRWKRVAMIAAGIFVLTMGALTAVELVAGKSVASMVGNQSSGSTTFGSVTTGDPGNRQQENGPAPQPSAGPTADPGEQSSTGPDEQASTPADAPASGGTTTEPTEAPTTEAPATGDAPADGGGTPDSGTGDGGGTGEGAGEQRAPQQQPQENAGDGQ